MIATFKASSSLAWKLKSSFIEEASVVIFSPQLRLATAIFAHRVPVKSSDVPYA
jgi:hypothetical protein